jgi:glycosyltransferase involved in cell wall biosynthesis
VHTVVFLGYNNPRTYKRGVENVIDIQARALPSGTRKVYFFFDQAASVFRWKDILCVGIRKGITKFLRLNVLVFRIVKAAQRAGRKVVIHSHYPQMTVLLFRQTDILTVHDGLWYLNKCFKSRIPWLFWAIERAAYMRTKRVQCNSHFTYAASQLPEVKRDATVIYCSTPMERYEVAKASFRSTCSSRRVVFSVRSIELRARIDLILEMAALAQQESLNIDFIVAGKGPLLLKYRQSVNDRKLRNIQLIGYVPDGELAARYRDCDCVLVTCENGEGFGLPVIEGYLFNKPVVASDKCAVPEVILEPKYLSKNEPEAMLQVLNSTLAEQVEDVRFLDHYTNHFANEVILKQFSELYEEAFD